MSFPIRVFPSASIGRMQNQVQSQISVKDNGQESALHVRFLPSLTGLGSLFSSLPRTYVPSASLRAGSGLTCAGPSGAEGGAAHSGCFVSMSLRNVLSGAEAQLKSLALDAGLKACSTRPKSTAARRQSKVNINVKGNGQECPFHTCRNGFRRTADSSLVLAAARLRTNSE